MVIAGLGTGAFFLSKRAVTQEPNVSVTVTPTAEPKQVSYLTWEDPAGFTFQYHEGITINKHDENQNDYAQIEMTHADHPGKLTVWASDTKYADVTAWIKGEKTFAGANTIDTSLGNQPAKKIMVSTEPNRLVTGTIFDQILFSVDAELADREYWTLVHNKIVDSFAFVPLEGEDVKVSQPAASTYEGTVDEEETLE